MYTTNYKGFEILNNITSTHELLSSILLTNELETKHFMTFCPNNNYKFSIEEDEKKSSRLR